MTHVIKQLFKLEVGICNKDIKICPKLMCSSQKVTATFSQHEIGKTMPLQTKLSLLFSEAEKIYNNNGFVTF